MRKGLKITPLKKHLFTIGLLLVLASAAFLCIYSVWNYKGDTSPVQNRAAGSNFMPGGQNRPSYNPGQERGPLPNQNTARPNGTFHRDMGSRGMSGANSHTDYAPQLVIYTLIFFACSFAAYYLFIIKKVKVHPARAGILIITLLGIGLLLRIYAATLMTGHNDINLFKNWASAAASNLFSVYSGTRSSDYPPLYMYVLYLIGKAASLPAVSPYYILLLKLPSILADIAASGLIYKLARKYLSLELSLVLSAFYIFNPATFINSAFWGQVDSFFTLLVILAVWMLSEKKLGLAAVFFTAAVLMKPQGIIFLPVLFYEMVRQKSFKSLVKPGIFALATALAAVLPFSLHQGWLWIFKLYAGTVGEYPYASVNAFNLFGLLGANYKSDTAAFIFFSYHTWGMIFIFLVTAFAWFLYVKGNNSKFAPGAALFQISGVFTLAASMHERYLFPAVALAVLAFIYLKDKRLLLLAAGFSLTVYINTHAVLFGNIASANSSYSPLLVVTSLLNVLLLAYLGKVLYDLAGRHKPAVEDPQLVGQGYQDQCSS